MAVAEIFINLLESLPAGRVSFDRVASVVLPSVSGMRRGPQQYSERFLRALLPWVPDEDRLATDNTTHFLLKLLGFVAAEPWVGAPLRAEARRVLLALLRPGPAAAEAAGALFEALHRSVLVRSVGPRPVRIPEGWTDCGKLAEVYLSQVGRIPWEDHRQARRRSSTG